MMVPVDQYEIQTEAVYMETNARENTNKKPRREDSGKGVEHLDMKFGGKKYDTQFTSTGNKKK